MKFSCKCSPLYLAGYIWLLVPCLIFISCWFRLCISIPVIALLLCGLLEVMNTPIIAEPFHSDTSISKKSACYLLLLAWVLFSGIGGLFWQDAWDHGFRNAIFFDLVNHSWPVIDFEGGTPELLCYYFGFWLPAALVSKAAGSLEIGYIFQLLYAAAGAVIALAMVFRHVGAVKLRVVLLFILFCGWDIAAYLIFNDYVSVARTFLDLKDLSYGYFSAPSATVQLYFIYNQGIAFWIAFMLLLKVKNHSRVLIFTYSLLSIFSPITAAGLAPLIAVWVLKDWKHAFSAANIGGLLFGLLSLSFFMSNGRAAGFGLNSEAGLLAFCLFILLSFGIYLPFVWNRIRCDSTFWVLFGTMCVLSWTRLGDSTDMSIRCAIPSFFYLLLTVMKETLSFDSWPKLRRILFLIVLGIGALSPLGVFARAALHNLNYYRGNSHSLRSEPYPTLFMDIPCHDNFIGTVTDSFYARYLMRRPTEPSLPSSVVNP